MADKSHQHTMDYPQSVCAGLSVFMARITLRLTKPAKLHAHPAAAVYALLARAYGQACSEKDSLPDGAMIDAPEQGRMRLSNGDTYALGVRLLSPSAPRATQTLTLLLMGLDAVSAQPGADRQALGGNFNVTQVEDRVSGQAWNESNLLAAMSVEHIASEITRLSGQGRITLRFLEPLRMKRPKNDREPGAGWFDAGYFNGGLFASRIDTRLRKIGLLDGPSPARPDLVTESENRLVWLDLTYGRAESRKALGGIVGRITLEVSDPSIVPALVWGQYVGAGEATRFGFGIYRIEELGPAPFHCRRAESLLEIALRGPVLDQQSEQQSLPPGRLSLLAERARQSKYTPEPAIALKIRRDDGSTRALAIAAREDAALQRVVLATIAPVLELFFEESSLAYRKGLGRHRAAQRIRNACAEGFEWALRSDFHRFFDEIDHGLLRDRLEAYLADDALVDLLMTWVRSAAPSPDKGLPTGYPIAPLLANLFLDGFDEALAMQGACLVRYADDFLVLFKSREEADTCHALVAREANALRLQLNTSKTEQLRLTRPFTFLGFQFSMRDRWEFVPPDGARNIRELGWEDAPRRAAPLPSTIVLPGERPDPVMGNQIDAVAGLGVTGIDVEGEQLLFRFGDSRIPEHVALNRLRELTVLGAPDISGKALKALFTRDIPVLFADERASAQAMLVPELIYEDAVLIREQVQAAGDPERRLVAARRLVSAKLRNYSALAAVCTGRKDDRTVSTALEALERQAREATDLESLLGFEGAGAARWYGHLPHCIPSAFSFERRVASRANDPVNVLLNIAQVFLHRRVLLELMVAGFTPSIGIMHAPRPGHAALASDLQEPFRHLMDRAVLEILTTLGQNDFERMVRGPYRLRLKPWAYHRFLALLHRNLNLGITAMGGSAPQPYRSHLRATVRGLRRWLLSGDDFYVFTAPDPAKDSYGSKAGEMDS